MRREVMALGMTLAVLFSAVGAQGALKSSAKEEKANPAAAYNPNAATDDLELPMPNGLKMVLRPVAIPAKGPLSDRQFNMGLRNPDDERGFYEKQFPAYVSAPLRQENMPAAWVGKLPTDEKNDYSYYLIGKYELSNGQWDAVMGGKSDARPELPKTNISWYDIQDFLRNYNEWLLKNHPDAVPAIDNVPAYLRLPTEAEWEFAARGGILAPENQNETDFPLADGEKIDRYAVFGDNATMMPIGKKYPNRLGIYDMAGNAAELVQSGFRFTVADRGGSGQSMRQHGSEGGLLSKGGQYNSTVESDLYPGKRNEIRMFEKQPDNTYAPHKENALGARLVLASVNVPGMGRAKEIMEQEKLLQATPPTLIAIDAGGDPLIELEKLQASAESPQMRDNIAKYREVIRNYNEAFNREHDANLLSMIRSAAYKADSLSNIAFRCYRVSNDLKTAKLQFKNLSKDIEETSKKEMKRNFSNLKLSTRLYRQSLREVLEYPKNEVDARIVLLRKEYAGDDQLNKNFRANLEKLGKHLELARAKGVNNVSDATIWNDIIPGKKTREVINQIAQEEKGK